MKTQELLETILESILYYPEEIEITSSKDNMGILYSIKVKKEEIGLLIGKGGATFKGIREVVRIAGRKNKESIHLKIVEEDNR